MLGFRLGGSGTQIAIQVHVQALCSDLYNNHSLTCIHLAVQLYRVWPR